MRRTILAYGVLGSILIALLELIRYRFLVVERSVEIYGALVAGIFAGVGIWLGLKLTRATHSVVVKEAPVRVSEPCVPVSGTLERLRIARREHEILALIAEGLSTREIAEKLFVS